MRNHNFQYQEFKKSSYSIIDCVEVAIGKDKIAVRDSKQRDQGMLTFTQKEWLAFIKGVKAGEFDLPE